MPIDDAPGHALHKVPVRNVIEGRGATLPIAKMFRTR
jgi:hypothetical protein